MATRRSFLRRLGVGSLAAAGMSTVPETMRGGTAGADA
jgi:hypothetical protein